MQVSGASSVKFVRFAEKPEVRFYIPEESTQLDQQIEKSAVVWARVALVAGSVMGGCAGRVMDHFFETSYPVMAGIGVVWGLGIALAIVKNRC